MTSRTILVTGAAAGINAATSAVLRADGHRVIGGDLVGADIEADLGTDEGRQHMVAQAYALAPDGIDGIVAGAGVSRTPDAGKIVSVNYFGAVATMEGLYPLLAKSASPRVVAVASTAILLPCSAGTVSACLAGDEPRAVAAARADAASAYMASKVALARWVRRAAITPQWAGRGISLNAVAPGGVRTAMLAGLDDSPEFQAVMTNTTPKAVSDYAGPEDLAEVIAFLVTSRTSYLVGQILFADGGTEAIFRGEDY